VNKQVSLPGFRKGKAPESLLLKNFSKYVEEEFKEQVLQACYEESTSLASVYPMGQKSIKNAKVEKSSVEEGCEAIFEFEAYPEVPDAGDCVLELEKVESKQVDEEAVQKELERIQKMFETFQDLEEDRAVQENDTVKLTLEDITDEEPQKVVNGEQVDISLMNSWLKEAVIGLKKTETAECESQVTDEMSDKEKENFESRKYKITVDAVLQKVLPEIDEELAKKVGLKSVEELNEKIKEKLAKEFEYQMQSEMRKQAEKKLAENFDFDLPRSIVDAENRSGLKERISQLKKEGKSDKEIEEQKEQLSEEVKEESSRKLRLLFLMRKLAEDLKMEASQEEVTQRYVSHLTQMMSMGGGNMDDEDKKRLMDYYTNAVLEEQVLDHLIKNAKVA
jgi:trigger factor